MNARASAGLRALGIEGDEARGLEAWGYLSGEFDAGRPRDRYGNPLAGERNLLETPLDEGRTSAWPGGAPYALALSHDLDDPIKGQLAYGLALAASGLVKGHAGARREGMARVRAWGSRPDPYFTFDAIRTLEEDEGVRSTFFGVSILDHDWEVRVSAAEDPVRSALKALAKDGWEVGLHGSNASASDGERLQAERERLEDAIGTPITSVRQHNLRWQGPASWVRQAAAGFRCDASVGFNGKPGFRAGTAYPFLAFGPEGEALDLVEVPHALMDTYLEAGQGEAVLEAARRAGGLACLNWHERAFCRTDFPGRAEAYLALIRKAKAEGAWIATVGEAAAFWRGRR